MKQEEQEQEQEQQQQNETTEAPRAKERNNEAVMGAFLSRLLAPQRDAKHTERLRAKVRGHIERMFPEAEAELRFAFATNAARQESGYDAARRIVARDLLVGRISACMVDPTTMGFSHVGGLRPEHARILRANNFSLYVKRGGKRPEGAKVRIFFPDAPEPAKQRSFGAKTWVPLEAEAQ